jgi:hypothetical protein
VSQPAVRGDVAFLAQPISVPAIPAARSEQQRRVSVPLRSRSSARQPWNSRVDQPSDTTGGEKDNPRPSRLNRRPFYRAAGVTCRCPDALSRRLGARRLRQRLSTLARLRRAKIFAGRSTGTLPPMT